MHLNIISPTIAPITRTPPTTPRTRPYIGISLLSLDPAVVVVVVVVGQFSEI